MSSSHLKKKADDLWRSRYAVSNFILFQKSIFCPHFHLDWKNFKLKTFTDIKNSRSFLFFFKIYFLEKMEFWDSVLCMSHFADKLRSITNAKWHLLFYLLQFILKTYLSSSIGTPIRFVYSCRILKMFETFCSSFHNKFFAC